METSSTGLSMLLGVGLGAAILTGELSMWRPYYQDTAADLYHAGNEPDGVKRIPKAIPVIDLFMGMRFNLGDRVFVRTEVGLHNIPFAGATVGLAL